MFWRTKMARKQEPETVEPTKPEPPKPVIAVEYNGTLSPSMQSAEGARAKADLMAIVCPAEPRGLMYDTTMGFKEWGRREALDAVIENAERVHGVLSRYLDAAKVS
jgi:acetaldehyde dehydrogenase (acetylating)